MMFSSSVDKLMSLALTFSRMRSFLLPPGMTASTPSCASNQASARFGR